MKPTPIADVVAEIVALLESKGFVRDGETRSEVVKTLVQNDNVPSGFSPKLSTFGGRARFHLPGTDLRCTVGKRCVCIYRRGRSEDTHVPSTRDTEKITQCLEQAIAKAKNETHTRTD